MPSDTFAVIHGRVVHHRRQRRERSDTRGSSGNVFSGQISCGSEGAWATISTWSCHDRGRATKPALPIVTALKVEAQHPSSLNRLIERACHVLPAHRKTLPCRRPGPRLHTQVELSNIQEGLAGETLDVETDLHPFRLVELMDGTAEAIIACMHATASESAAPCSDRARRSSTLEPRTCAGPGAIRHIPRRSRLHTGNNGRNPA